MIDVMMMEFIISIILYYVSSRVVHRERVDILDNRYFIIMEDE